MPGRGLNQNNSGNMWRFCDTTGRNRPVLSLHHSSSPFDPKASILGLKTFPGTLFACAFLMVFSVFVNWSVLVAFIAAEFQ